MQLKIHSKTSSAVLLCTALAMTAASASAMVIETSQFAFDADPATLTATLTEPMTNLRGHIIVPETVTGSDGAVYTVTAIAPEALSNLGHIEVLDLPGRYTDARVKGFCQLPESYRNEYPGWRTHSSCRPLLGMFKPYQTYSW